MISEDGAIATGFALVVVLAGVLALSGAAGAALLLSAGYLFCFGVICAWRKWL